MPPIQFLADRREARRALTVTSGPRAGERTSRTFTVTVKPRRR